MKLYMIKEGNSGYSSYSYAGSGEDTKPTVFLTKAKAEHYVKWINNELKRVKQVAPTNYDMYKSWRENECADLIRILKSVGYKPSDTMSPHSLPNQFTLTEVKVKF